MKQQLVVFIINGTKRLTPINKSTIHLCENHPLLTVEKYTTLSTGHAKQLALDHAHRSDVLVSVGGDGTFNELINGWFANPHAKSVVAVLPNGTGNDFYRSAKLNCVGEKFIHSIVNEVHHPIDVAKLFNERYTRYFANIADIGFGGKVVFVLEKQRKLFKGKIAYGLAILRTFLGYRPPKLSIKWDNGEFTGSVFMMAICNGELFGDGLYIHPGALIHDGKLNITLLKKIGLLDYIKNLSNLRKGIHIDHPEATYFTTQHLTIQDIEGNASMECDGETVEEMNVSIELVHNKIRLLGYFA